MSDETTRKFTKLTEAEQAEFTELISDSFDPDLYLEDDLPMLRASRKKLEETHRREKAAPVPDECDGPCDEDLEQLSDSFDPWQWRR